MSSPILSNIMSSKIRENLRLSEKRIEDSTRKLSSGKQVNSATDSTVGLAVSIRMGIKESGLKTASSAMEQGVSMLETADSAFSTIQGMLHNMADTMTMAANGTFNEGDKELLMITIREAAEGVQYIANQTHYNGHKLLSNELPEGFSITIPTSDQVGDTLDLTHIFTEEIAVGASQGSSILDMNPFKTMLQTPDAYFNPLNPDKFLTDIKEEAMEFINQKRVATGATMNRLDYAISNANNAAISTSQAVSRIADADMAAEMSELTKGKILAESSISMLSQANSSAEMLLNLFD